jgi:hypothetical protein
LRPVDRIAGVDGVPHEDAENRDWRWCRYLGKEDARCYLRNARRTNDFDKDLEVSGKGNEVLDWKRERKRVRYYDIM